MTPNKTFVYKQAPSGVPVAGQDISVETHSVNIDTPPKGGIILQINYASLDPYLRGRMRDPSVKSYAPPLKAGDGIANMTLATVIKSDASDFSEGDVVLAFVPIAQYAIIEKPDELAASSRLLKVENPLGLDPALFLGPLGMPGLTAWAGLHKIGKPQKGETIFVSSAAGAVGGIVGQIAKREGLRVIGSVGSDEKLKYIVEELGFDAGFNYKKESPLDALKRLAPDGIDIDFENVGGDHLDASLENMNAQGRVVLCGLIESYNTPKEQQKGAKNLMALIRNNITMEGFLVGQPSFGPAYSQEHQEKMQAWFHEGSIKGKLHVTEGIDNAPRAFVGLLEGENLGKAVVKI